MARDPYLPEFDTLEVPLPSQIEESEVTQDTYSWNAPEYLHFQRGKWWYFGMIFTNVALVGYALWSGSFIFLLTILVFYYIYYRAHRQEDIRFFPVHMTAEALIHADKRIPYARIESYFILSSPEGKSLHLRVRKYRREKVIYLPVDVDIQKIRTSFPAQIKEIEDPTEDILHYLARLLKL